MMAGHSGTKDAAEVGQALAFPHGLRRQLAVMAADEEPVRAATRAVWAGLDDLQLVTAALNGSTTGMPVTATGKAVGPMVAGTGETAEAGRVPRSSGGQDIVARVSETVRDGGTAEVPRAVPGDTAHDYIPRRMPGPSAVTTAVVSGSVGPRAGGLTRYAANDGVESGAAPVLRGAQQADVGQANAGRAADEPESDGAKAGLISRGLVVEVMQEAGLAPARAFDEVAGSTAPASDATAIAERHGLRADVAAALRGRVQGAALAVGDSDLAGGRLEVATLIGTGRRGPLAGPAAPSGDGLQGGLDAGTAPLPPERGSDGMGGGGGAVMMDGRLVGQWVSDRMAMDAARPGAGTTFFDPRQSPAWTPSGAV